MKQKHMLELMSPSKHQRKVTQSLQVQKKEVAKDVLSEDNFKGLLPELCLECDKEKPKHDFICSILRQTLRNWLQWRELETEQIAYDIYLKVPCFNTDKHVSIFHVQV